MIVCCTFNWLLQIKLYSSVASLSVFGLHSTRRFIHRPALHRTVSVSFLLLYSYSYRQHRWDAIVLVAVHYARICIDIRLCYRMAKWLVLCDCCTHDILVILFFPFSRSLYFVCIRALRLRSIENVLFARSPFHFITFVNSKNVTVACISFAMVTNILGFVCRLYIDRSVYYIGWTIQPLYSRCVSWLWAVFISGTSAWCFFQLCIIALLSFIV